jgi:uncharacterized protein (UPF0332 family)
MDTGLKRQIISVYKQRCAEIMRYAELDFKSRDYTRAFLRSLSVIGDMGSALLISKGYYVPSNRYVFKVLHLRDIPNGYDRYLANPDEEVIEKEEAEAALSEGKQLLSQAKDI